ncbi:MAG: acyl-CoA dehydratase activase-related protein, partial [Planctomycetota bacterium]
EYGLTYLSPFVDFADVVLLEELMRRGFEVVLGVSREEYARACAEGWKALRAFEADLRQRGRETLAELERDHRVGIVVLGRPYHNDPGINHEILVELQKKGYPILTQDTLPMDDDILGPLFREDVEQGIIQDPRDITDVWKNCYSENTNRKVWAAKFVARHPLLVGLELSSFKCGHDAPIYTVVEEIVEKSGTPFFSFRDIDENKPTGSIKIRVETISYFLTRYRQDLVRERDKRLKIEDELLDFEARLRSEEEGVSAGEVEAQRVAAG